MHSRLRALAAEPLLHFFFIGLVLFALYTPAPEAPAAGAIPAGARRLEVPAGIRDSLKGARRDEWIDQEILYREALARGLGRDDDRIRRLLAQKMVFVFEAQAFVPEPSEEELRAFFDANPSLWPQTAYPEIREDVKVAWTLEKKKAAVAERLRALRSQWQVVEAP